MDEKISPQLQMPASNLNATFKCSVSTEFPNEFRSRHMEIIVCY